jgi:hypothetical protein
MNDVQMHVIAALLGHANGDLRMVTKHYGHLSDLWWQLWAAVRVS